MTDGKTDKIFVLLPSQEHWRQVLIFPAVRCCQDSVTLHRSVSNCVLWMELVNGKVWSFSFRRYNSFLPTRELVLIAKRLETARAAELDAVLVHLANLLNWYWVDGPSVSITEVIAEDMVKAQLKAAGNDHYSYLATDSCIRLASRPYLARFHAGLKAFNEALDQEALALTGKEMLRDGNDLMVYNNLISPFARTQNYRRQALQAFPLLREPLTSASAEFRVRRLQQNVDSGNPLIPVLSDYFRAPIPVIRFLAGKDFSLVGEAWRSQLDQMVDILLRIKPGFWPQEREDWQQFTAVILRVCGALGDLRNREYPEILSRCLNDLAKEGCANLPARLRRYRISLVDICTIPDFERALREWAVQVGARQVEASEALWHYSVFKIGILSHRWHDWLARRLEENEAQPDEDELEVTGWLTLISAPWHRGSHTVVPLNYPWALQDEGRQMQHCVGTYVSACRYLGAHIFSIRDSATGRPLSTVELHLERGRGHAEEVIVVQHRGYRNSEPDEECNETLQQFLRYLKVNLSREQIEKIRQQLHERCLESDEYRRLVSRPVWPRRRVEEFRALLQGYPLLEGLGAARQG